MIRNSTPRTCSNGHRYYKSSDCPTCPICEQENKPNDGFLSRFSAPARRALLSNGINTVRELAQRTEKEVLKFHGMGKASIPALRASLKEQGLKFKTS